MPKVLMAVFAVSDKAECAGQIPNLSQYLVPYEVVETYLIVFMSFTSTQPRSQSYLSGVKNLEVS